MMDKYGSVRSSVFGLITLLYPYWLMQQGEGADPRRLL
ncbi:unnamed protein product [Acidithrix sp. C25]|nr:unnamed protein product [Acidithrix sp. C25]